MTEAELQKNIAEDLKAVLEEARSMGCTDVKAFHHIPLKNVAVVVDALKKQIAKKPIVQGLGQRYCPVCKCGGADHQYCARCGQKLDR